jgi:hypothetical protein
MYGGPQLVPEPSALCVRTGGNTKILADMHRAADAVGGKEGGRLR